MTTYTYVVEASDDGETWTPEDAAATHREESDLGPVSFGLKMLHNRPWEFQPTADPESRPVDPAWVRVVVWYGTHPGTTDTAAAIVNR